MKKRIIIFSVDYFPYIGGAEVAVRELVARFTSYECTVITCRNDRKLPCFSPGVPDIIRVGFGVRWLDKWIFPFTGFFAARRLYREKPFYGIISVLANPAGIAALFLKYAKSSLFYALLAQEGDSDLEYRRRIRFWKPLYRLIHTKADIVIAVSHFLEKRTRALGYTGRILVIHNGVDLAVFCPEEISRQKERTIITVSRLVHKNGIADLISAVAMLPDLYKDVSLVIVGDGPLRPSLTSHAERLGVIDRIIFIGSVPYEAVPHHMRSADIFIRPSLSESFGNVFLEAMACGIPVIGTSVGGIPEIIKNGENGLLVPPGSPTEIRDAIVRMLSDSSLYVGCARAGRVTASHNSWDVIAREMEACLDSLQ